MQVRSLPPQVEGVTRYRLYAREHIDFDALPSYHDGGPAMVVINGYQTSTSNLSGFSSAAALSADDGKYTLNLSKPVRGPGGGIAGFDKHALDGTKYDTAREASRAAYDAGALAFMVYERNAAKWGLPAE